MSGLPRFSNIASILVNYARLETDLMYNLGQSVFCLGISSWQLRKQNFVFSFSNQLHHFHMFLNKYPPLADSQRLR